MVSLKMVALGELDDELAGTRRVLERIPGEELGWRPHHRSYTIGALGMHIAGLPSLMALIIQTKEFDLDTLAPTPPIPGSTEEILDEYDRNVHGLREALKQADNLKLTRDWSFKKGSHVISQKPRWEHLRIVGLNHLIHHRAQLTVYLRLLNIPVPGMYGPSGDEQ